MSTQVLDGKKIALLRKKNVQQYISENNLSLSLVTILVGNDPASQIYVNMKIKACQEVGIKPIAHFLNESCSQQELLLLIQSLNQNPSIHGILVQLPLPRHIDSNLILEAIDPKKDVDCFHPYNIGKLYSGISSFAPATPTGIINLLDSYNINLESKKTLMIGISNIVGRPMISLLLQKKATVLIAHDKSLDLPKLCQEADIIISGTGQAHLVKDVKQGAVVIDVGSVKIPYGEGYKIVGDVDFDKVQHRCSAITPVPGGVGPMTISALLENLIFLYLQFYK